jgi:hypothetical protein
VNVANVRTLLQEFDFKRLFVEELGWSRPAVGAAEAVECGGTAYTARHVAELSGVVVLEVAAEGGAIPGAKARADVHRTIAARYHENLLVFVDGERTQSLWYWVKREEGKQFPREHLYVKGQPGDLFISKLSGIVFDISRFEETGGVVGLVEVADRLKSALDVERVTKRFFEKFKDQRLEFTALIEGISDEREQRWYASVLLNRLMFVYFLQSKGFVDGGRTRYLQEHLAAALGRFGPDGYYERFLKPLFFEGFARPEAERSEEARRLLGSIVYLNGGLFLKHPIEERNPDIRIPDAAFANLFALFGAYSWNLNDTPGGRDDEINPDVLGYIFEKYINQKAFGAYYTRPEITEYLCEHTIHQLVLDGIDPGMDVPGLPPPRRFESLADLLLNLDAPLCRRLLFDVLPGLNLLDPACGSGAFLVAAMKTLINVYSAVTGRIDYLNDSHLSEWLKETRRVHPSINYFIKRKIITENLFGVDIMEEGCEIARLRLFLALVSSARTVADLEPLPNIDFNIVAGNSLVGLLHVEDAEFNKRNAQGSLFRRSYREVLEEKNRLVGDYRKTSEYCRDLQEMRDAISEKKAEARATLDEILLEEMRRLGVRFEQATWDDARGDEGKPLRRALALDDVRALRPFHWGYEFDEALNQRGGFDAIITNPPWEIFKPNAKEFFMEHSELVTKNKMTIKEFEEKQGELLQVPAIRAAWLEYLSQFPHVSAYYRSAKQYENQISVVNGKKAGTDINLYKLFVEQCYNLLRPGGQCGIVVPSGLYTDLGTKQLRELLFSSTRITGLFCFENRKMIFEGVDSRFKFIVLTLAKVGRTESFPSAFMRHDVAELATFPRHGALEISVELIRRLSPDSLSVMEFKSEADVRIAEKMLRLPLLGERIEGTWNLVLANEFHMTNDSKLFHTSSSPERIPLFTGKMFNQFSLTAEHSGYWIDEGQGRAALLGKTHDAGQNLDYQGYRWVHRRIARNTDSRTMISTLTPRNVFTEVNSTTIRVRESGISNGQMLVLCAFANSVVLDWMLRQKVSSTLNMFYIYQLPVPRLTESDPGFRPIVERAARLICTTPEFDDLAREVGLLPLPAPAPSPPGPLSLDSLAPLGGRGGARKSPAPLEGEGDLGGEGARETNGDSGAQGGGPARAVYGVTDPAGRARLRAELDALVARLYGLTEDELAHILASFPLVAESVKADVLAAFRAIAPAEPIPPPDPVVEETARLIRGGENDQVEFKRTLEYVADEELAARHIPPDQKPSIQKEVVRSSLKTICAFLNSAGGTLLIGAHDEGYAVGIENDLTLLGREKRTADGFELKLRSLLKDRFEPLPLEGVSVRFPVVEGRMICRVDVTADRAEVTHLDGKVYVRHGNQTIELTGAELTHWIRRRGAV